MRGKKPTRREKELLEENGKRPSSWLKQKELKDSIIFVSRTSDRTISLAK